MFFCFFYHFDYKDKTLKLDNLKFILILLFSCFIIAFPDYGFNVIFGPMFGFKVYGGSLEHIVVIVLLVVLLAFYYFLLKNYDKEMQRYLLLIFSITAFFSYNANIKGALFRNINYFPLHLCNTAMYIIPFSLIIKSKELFHYTLFVNLIGAFLAMLFPIEYVSITSPEFMEYFYNHYDALIFPLLIMFLGIFPRPINSKVFKNSLLIFSLYFALVYILDLFFNCNYFFLNENKVPLILGDWAIYLYELKYELHIGTFSLTFRPFYRILFFLVYIIGSLAMFYLYKICFILKDMISKTTQCWFPQHQII